MSDALQCATCDETYRIIRKTHRNLYVQCDCGETSIRVATTLPGETA